MQKRRFIINGTYQNEPFIMRHGYVALIVLVAVISTAWYEILMKCFFVIIFSLGVIHWNIPLPWLVFSLLMKPLGPERKRQRGRPRTTWRRSTEKELKTIRLTWSEIRKVAQDRSRWRKTVKALCAIGTDDDDVLRFPWCLLLMLRDHLSSRHMVIFRSTFSKSSNSVQSS